MGIQKYPCADCPDCIAIGNGEGLCDYKDAEIVVDLFDVYPYCPKPKKKKKNKTRRLICQK